VNRSPALPHDPLTRAARALPAVPLQLVLLAVKLAGAALAVAYAYDQDVLFPDRHFPRTWTFAVVVAGLSLLSLLPVERLRFTRGPAAAYSAAGVGGLLFGGAALASRGTGAGVVICGAIAWAASFVLSRRAGVHPLWSLAGIAAGGGIAFVAIGFCYAFVGA
jgi:hypothetical protein